MTLTTNRILTGFLLSALALNAVAHQGHVHDGESSGPTAVAAADSNAVTGGGAYRFRYNAELSRLPEEIARGVKPAHGGFAITPSGEIYFGLEKTGLVRISADLREKTLVKAEGPLLWGGLHNTGYVEHNGGALVLPDNNTGRILVVDTNGELIAILRRPGADIDPYYGDESNPYRPTDTVMAPNGLLYVLDGYSPSKYVLTLDLDAGRYVERVAGGADINGAQAPGKFSTCHGLTWDPIDETLAIADRELHRVQKIGLDGGFVSEFDVDGANPCDISFVEWDGELLGVIGCLRGKGDTSGVVHLTRGTEIVATLKPKDDLGLEEFEHVHNALGVVVQGRLYVLCYGWNPDCFAVLEHAAAD